MCKVASKEPSLALIERFKTGLMKKHNMKVEDLKKYEYCGGSSGAHFKYWVLRYGPFKELPLHQETCVCYQPIAENCFITNGKEYIVLGNCCIKRFVPKCTRTCERCGDPHKNRIINRCNECREIGFCKKCKKKIDEKYTLCYTCKNPNNCIDCGKSCDKKYKRCFTCNQTHRENRGLELFSLNSL